MYEIPLKCKILYQNSTLVPVCNASNNQPLSNHRLSFTSQCCPFCSIFQSSPSLHNIIPTITLYLKTAYMSRYVLSLCIIFFTISSCCKKILCDENRTIMVSFHGFTQTELDTIYTTGYQLGSGFTIVGRPQQTDTVMPDTNNPDSVYTLFIGTQYNGVTFFGDYGLNDDYEWKLNIPATGKTVAIHHYGYQSYRCSNGCGFRKGQEVKSLSTCSVDKTTMPVGNIRIYK